MIEEIQKCRVCGNKHLHPIIHLGSQYLTGVFPRYKNYGLTQGPLQLVKCHGDSDHSCGLLQLAHNYDLEEMYGDNYGYRSGLNQSMVNHLQRKVANILKKYLIVDGDLIVDIGSNDGTTLCAYPRHLNLVGIDPTGNKFRSFYPDHIHLIQDFFSAQVLTKAYPGQKAKVITSIAMFYDLIDPIGFVEQVASVLDPDSGVWIFEQSYMPLMLERLSYDTICHEHLEYYGLRQIAWIMDKVGLEILDVEINDVNGGSFSVTVAHKTSRYYADSQKIAKILDNENTKGLSTLEVYSEFADKVRESKRVLQDFVYQAKSNSKRVVCLGASTKGNVVLQYCEFTENEIEAIGEVNTDKYGALTPGTWIPIRSESEVLASDPDYLIVLPWHFRDFFTNHQLFKGRNLVFPLPVLQIVTPESK
ncbi:class I SAM-dependent methyltransferase [Cylindrospermopsis raciborskii]|uniref:class I SAM-dependent methyltransferase n=1 Tax=Cylindrospermopsis raciborskii TaxID=77022 RepID=UPI0011412541|nr:class I SAM-dependent methyltransferase [Cylindrospermopsis raciborskii]TPX27655.1 class I SAM-dependent methyltransferase [Cylindrospermopsis raciborskii GIHE 2018]